MKIDFKKLLPHLYVILFFIVICAVYFSPVLEGKKLHQGDIEQWEGMSKEIQDFTQNPYGHAPCLGACRHTRYLCFILRT